MFGRFLSCLWAVVMLLYSTVLPLHGIVRAQDPAAEGQPVANVLKSRIDWHRRTVTFGVASPITLYSVSTREGIAATEMHIIAAARRTADGEDLFQITGPVDSFLEHLVPETRSLWLLGEKTSERIRLDLPCPEITGLQVEPPTHPSQGPRLRIQVSGLLPGFQVLHRTHQHADDTKPQSHAGEKPLTETGWKFPHLVATENTADGQAVVSIQFSPDEPDRIHGFALLNADGSRSQTIHMALRDGTFDRSSGTIPFPKRPLPVDSEVAVPGVELLSVSQAASRAEGAGLHPVVIELATHRELSLKGLDDVEVLRQGLAPGSRSRMGETLLLGIAGDLAESGPFEADPMNIELYLAPPLDTDDGGGFVMPNEGTEFGGFEPDFAPDTQWQEHDFQPNVPLALPVGEEPDWMTSNPPPLDWEPDAEWEPGESFPTPDTEPDNWLEPEPSGPDGYPMEPDFPDTLPLEPDPYPSPQGSALKDLRLKDLRLKDREGVAKGSSYVVPAETRLS